MHAVGVKIRSATIVLSTCKSFFGNDSFAHMHLDIHAFEKHGSQTLVCSELVRSLVGVERSETILDWISLGLIWYVHFATPCKDYSNARRRVRESQDPAGATGLTNTLLEFTVQCIQVLARPRGWG